MHCPPLKFQERTQILWTNSSSDLPRLFLSLIVRGLLGATCWQESGCCWGWSSSKPSSARVFDGDMLGTGIFVSVRLDRLNRSTGCGGRTPAGLCAGRREPSHEEIRTNSFCQDQEATSTSAASRTVWCFLCVWHRAPRPASLYNHCCQTRRQSRHGAPRSARSLAEPTGFNWLCRYIWAPRAHISRAAATTRRLHSYTHAFNVIAALYN